MAMSHSKSSYCCRCNRAITSKSFFAVLLWAKDESVLHDIVKVGKMPSGAVAIHLGGDRECKMEVSGFHGKILKKLELPLSCDTVFLNSL